NILLVYADHTDVHLITYTSPEFTICANKKTVNVFSVMVSEDDDNVAVFTNDAPANIMEMIRLELEADNIEFS
ncbi:hypothetical protein N9043_01985, partial [bacterium]|nr:hypothetical protein [bacterium]